MTTRGGWRVAVSALIVALAACQPRKGDGAGGSAPEAPPTRVKPVPEAGTSPEAAADARLDRLATAPAAMPIVYTIYPGDQLRLTVLGHTDLSFSFRVPSEGMITFPLVGRIQLAGRSLAEVEKEIRERLEKDYLVDPQVSLLIESYSKKFVYVFGGVKEPKAYELPEGQPLSLTQVLSMAGGFSLDAAKDRVRVIRRGGDARPGTAPGAPTVQEIDVTKITEDGQFGLEVQVGPGDVVVVPSLRKIYVLGQVKTPGGLNVTSDQRITVTQAISLSGGFTTVASERGVKVLRREPGTGKQTVMEVDVWSVIQGRLENDVELMPGDIVFVPESLF
jgi:polysaccharide export outer membrane protein